MATWHNEHWATRDHVIPFRLFYVMLATLSNVTAADQLNTYYAALLAGAQIMGSTEGRSTRDAAVQALAKTAYPEARRRRPARTSDQPEVHHE